MKIRNPNSGKGKKESTEESSDESGSTNDENSSFAFYDCDTDETISLNLGSSESEEEDSSDCSSDNSQAQTNKRKRKHSDDLMSNSKSDEGNSSDDCSDSQVKIKKRKGNHPCELASNSTDSGDETCEKCAICLRSILNQEVGSPEGCDHLFCSVCITEWSKNSNVCPLDRQKFSIILVRKNKNGNVVKQLSVEEPKSCYLYDDDGDNTYCEICGESDREDTMLLCDGCQRGFHIECLTPPLEEVPADEEWFCPTCSVVFSVRTRNEVLQDLEELNDIVRHRRIRSTRRTNGPGTRIRTRLMERIRIAVNRIVRSCFLDSDQNDNENDSDFAMSNSESESSFPDEVVSTESRPGTSGTQRRTRRTTSSRKTKTKGRKGSTKKSGSKRKKAKHNSKKKSAGSKRKAKSRSTATSKKVKVTDSDGNVKIIKRRSYKKRRKQKVKKKVKTAASVRKTSGASAAPKTVKGRLAMTLGMVPATKPGQLLPEVKVRSGRNELSGIDINRARAGIPRLHIFEPRNELQLYSSGSDGEEYTENGSSSLTTFAQPRITVSSMRDRKRAALLLQSAQPASVRPRPTVEEPAEEVDILDSILRSQAIWHSKNTDVKIKEDGSVEVSADANKKIQGENNKGVDVRGNASETSTTQAPLYPGSSSRPGGFRPYNRTSFGESRGTQDNSGSGRGTSSQTGMGFSRFGSASRNDREGYANYLNNMPQGPTPFCRGGPPLRFRMPSRQQLRRIPFPPRTNRSPWQNEEDEDETESGNKGKEEQSGSKTVESKKTDDEDVDLYSDIESNVEKADSSEQDESSGPSYPALGPPPEPSAFLLGIDENGEIAVDKSKSEAYDPAEPCDSEDEMVIDEHIEKLQSPEGGEKETEQSQPESTLVSHPVSPAENISPKPPCQKGFVEEEDDECPIFSIYSSASREFSQKEEEEREREIAEEKRRFEEVESHDEKTNGGDLSQTKPATEREEENLKGREHKETSSDNRINNYDTISDKDINESERNRGNKLSFNVDMGDDTYQSHDDDDSNSRSDVADRRSRSEISFGDPTKSPDSESGRSPLRRSPSVDSEKGKTAKTPSSIREKSSSIERSMAKVSRGDSKSCDSDSEAGSKKPSLSDDEQDERKVSSRKKLEKAIESGSESAQTKIATGLEGLDVEEVSSDNGEEDEFIERSLSSFSLSDVSNRSQESPSRRRKRRKKKRKSVRKTGKKYDEENDDVLKGKKKEDKSDVDKVVNEDIENEGLGEKHKKRKSKSVESDRQVLGNKDNKKDKSKEKEKDLSWKKPSKKEKNYREGKKRSKERGRSRSRERRKSRSPSPKKDKKKGKDRRKKSEKKKDIERYDVRKIVKNKEIRKTDAFGRDILSKSRSISRSRSRSPIRERSRNMLRRDSRSYTRSPSRGYRRGRSPVRRRYQRSRTKSRSKSLRRSFSRSRSPSRSARKTKKKLRSKDRFHGRSRSRGKKSRSRRRSPTRSRSRTPISRVARGKRPRSRRSWSRNSRSLSFSPRRSRSISRTPARMRRSYTRSASSSWSRGRSSIPRGGSLEKLTVVLKTKDKKKGKKKKDGKKNKRDDDRRKQSGNSKEVFASGDNVLVSVNFGNNNNSASNSNNGSASNEISRNTRLDSMSPAPSNDRKKKKGSDYEVEKPSKKSKKSNTISKNVVDMALSNSSSKRTKKLTRLSEKDAEVILNRKPVAVIDLDMSPYREQTPSPVNVVVVSDSGSGDEGKEPTPQGQNESPSSEPGKNQEIADTQSTNVSIPSSPVTNGYLTGPKTPPEPQIKFSIAKPQQLRPIANPLGDDDDDDDEEEEEEVEDEEEEDTKGVEDQEFKRIESLDRRIEKELDASHKGPNTPPEPRGPSTPQTPPSPQTSPDAYDPFEPTKSRSPTPAPADKEIQQSPSTEKNDEQPPSSSSETPTSTPSCAVLSEMEKAASDPAAENQEDQSLDMTEKCDVVPVLESSIVTTSPEQQNSTPASEAGNEDSPEKKISVVITTQQNKVQAQSAAQKSYSMALKPLCMTPTTSTSTPTITSCLSMPFCSFSLPSPTRTRSVPASQPVQVTGIQRLQHRLGSPVNRTPNSVKSTPEKRSTPRTDSNDAGSFRASSKRNGEQSKQARSLQDATNEAMDMTADMDDSPYSPASSEGDDLFDPPMEPTKAAQPNAKSIQPGYKPPPAKTPHKSPIKQLSKFDLLFGPTGPNLSPLKVGGKKPKPSSKAGVQPKTPTQKTTKKNAGKRGISLKMDEDQLRILDELPSSAVELQVKDKFLKKLNRQERVVDEVKTVLKPHYARKHITKEEYKDILRRSVPKICHSRSGEINPSKIQSLIEAYVRKFRHAKKKGSSNTVLKTKVK